MDSEHAQSISTVSCRMVHIHIQLLILSLSRDIFEDCIIAWTLKGSMGRALDGHPLALTSAYRIYKNRFFFSLRIIWRTQTSGHPLIHCRTTTKLSRLKFGWSVAECYRQFPTSLIYIVCADDGYSENLFCWFHSLLQFLRRCQ